MMERTPKKPVVLIVDDVSENIRILIETLGDDYTILVAKDGETALQKASNNPMPDLILLDIMMPDLDGYEVCRRLKENPKTKNIPVIFITAVSESVDEAKGFRLGAVDYITKPFNSLFVKARVKTHVELKNKTDKLEELSFIDGLTNVYNRRKFDEIFLQEWQRAYRNKECLAAIMIDIDHFKQFNDHYGHAQGDECLRRVAYELSICLKRTADFLARYGGEEFVVVLPQTDASGAKTIAEQLRQAVLSLKIVHQYSTAAAYVTISVGVATAYPHHGKMTPKELIEAADQMLYTSKTNGRNRVTCFDTLDLQINPNEKRSKNGTHQN